MLLHNKFLFQHKSIYRQICRKMYCVNPLVSHSANTLILFFIISFDYKSPLLEQAVRSKVARNVFSVDRSFWMMILKKTRTEAEKRECNSLLIKL